MKKALPYILVSLLLGAIIVLFISGNKKNRKLDERVTLRKKDKIPYGTNVAYRNLKYIFPKATVIVNRRQPGYWDSLSNYTSDQAFISIADMFSPTEYEMKQLISFAEMGNEVFISARYISATADDLLGCNSSTLNFSFAIDDAVDTISMSLSHPPFNKNETYKYPGRTFYSYFSSIDSSTTDILGYDEKKRPNFIHLRAGKGNFYVHMEPLAFGNYFLLHKENIQYYEKAISVINPHVKKVAWDEYFLYNDFENNQKKSWFSVLMKYPGLRAGLLTAIFTLLFFVLMEMRRKQRPIPIVHRPKNESLDFVKTIGRLYYDKGDHRNLCRKMGSYFLEHVRSKYKLATGKLDQEFVNNLQFKSGIEGNQVLTIVSFIKYIDEAAVINQKQVFEFHKQLESFYKNT